MRVSLKLQRRKIVTVVYNTEHVVVFASYRRQARDQREHATKIAEVSDANTPQERELPVGDDRGFLWRLNAYWRYEQVAGGVIAECEFHHPEPRHTGCREIRRAPACRTRGERVDDEDAGGAQDAILELTVCSDVLIRNSKSMFPQFSAS